MALTFGRSVTLGTCDHKRTVDPASSVRAQLPRGKLEVRRDASKCLTANISCVSGAVRAGLNRRQELTKCAAAKQEVVTYSFGLEGASACSGTTLHLWYTRIVACIDSDSW
eukprot:3356886-Pyramimonas_sp.AAC.3